MIKWRRLASLSDIFSMKTVWKFYLSRNWLLAESNDSLTNLDNIVSVQWLYNKPNLFNFG